MPDILNDPSRPSDPAEICNCFAVRKAARHVSQLYDRCLASAGLTGNQYSTLHHLARLGPLTINELALALGMDRTTMGRNIRPLERDGFIAIAAGGSDRRRRALSVTPAGAERLKLGRARWQDAQTRLDQAFGPERSRELRAMLAALVACDLVPFAHPAGSPPPEETARAV